MIDELLVKKFLKGDEKAFEKIVEAYLNRLFKFAYQLTGDSAMAEDIVQESFVKVWKNLAIFDEKKKFSTWIFAITKNTAYDFLKKKKAVPFSAFQIEEGENALEQIEDIAIKSGVEFHRAMDNEKEVRQMLAKLEPHQCTIVLLYHEQGFSLVEIAEILGFSHNTVKSTYRRSILTLKKIFKKDAPEIFPAS